MQMFIVEIQCSWTWACKHTSVAEQEPSSTPGRSFSPWFLTLLLFEFRNLWFFSPVILHDSIHMYTLFYGLFTKFIEPVFNMQISISKSLWLYVFYLHPCFIWLLCVLRFWFREKKNTRLNGLFFPWRASSYHSQKDKESAQSLLPFRDKAGFEFFVALISWIHTKFLKPSF